MGSFQIDELKLYCQIGDIEILSDWYAWNCQIGELEVYGRWVA